tara:strand:+ start:943 stop:1452 length:510 start_codon:yes stop_codon:yes gene_type:complete
MIEIDCVNGFDAREWNSKQGDKHNIYIKSSDGEIGWLDLQTGKFHNKSESNFGFVGGDSSRVTIKHKDSELYLGYIDNDVYSGDSDDELESLKESISKLTSQKFDGFELELNIGPSREIRKNGKSAWAKANITVRVQNPEDIESMYSAVSDMAASMLEIETKKLINRHS